MGISVPRVRAPYLSGVAFGGHVHEPVIDAAPLQDRVALGGRPVDVDVLAILAQLLEEEDQLLAVDVDAVLEMFVGLVGIEFEIELILTHLPDVLGELRFAE